MRAYASSETFGSKVEALPDPERGAVIWLGDEAANSLFLSWEELEALGAQIESCLQDHARQEAAAENAQPDVA